MYRLSLRVSHLQSLIHPPNNQIHRQCLQTSVAARNIGIQFVLCHGRLNLDGMWFYQIKALFFHCWNTADQ